MLSEGWYVFSSHFTELTSKVILRGSDVLIFERLIQLTFWGKDGAMIV